MDFTVPVSVAVRHIIVQSISRREARLKPPGGKRPLRKRMKWALSNAAHHPAEAEQRRPMTGYTYR